MANVDSVPAGKYGKAALTSSGVWDAVEDRVAQAENVRAALALVATGEAPLGIVYETDAEAEPDGQGRRHLPGGQPPADHLSCRGDRRGDERAMPRPSSTSCAPRRRRSCSRSRASRVLAPALAN